MNSKKYDRNEPFVLPVGMYNLNESPDYNFQLNRLVNMDLGDLEKVRIVGQQIKDVKSWKEVLIKAGDDEYAKGDLKSAMGFYRMAEFYMSWRDPDALKYWSKAREIFFEYFEEFFVGEQPVVERVEVPYDTYTMPLLKMNPDGESKGDIVVHGGFDSNYEEFFPQCMYLRQNGYTVYLFEGPGQGATIRLHGATLPIEWEKPVKAVLDYMKLTDVTLVGQSYGGFYAPRASAFDERIKRCVSVAQFPALSMNLHDSRFKAGLIWGTLNVMLFLFGWLINLLYKLKKGKGMDFFDVYFHRTGAKGVYSLLSYLRKIDLRPLKDRLTKDYLIIGGSKDTMSARASIGRQMFLLKNAKSVMAREITEKEQGADHCNVGNQQVAMDTILLWLEGLDRRDETLCRVKEV